MNWLIAAAFAVIIGALVVAGVFMIRGGREGSRSGDMMRALTVRIAVSVVLFICILIAWRFGWIHPGGVPLRG